MADKTGEPKEASLKRSAEKLTEEIQNMANYKSLYTEIQVHTCSGQSLHVRLINIL